MFRFIETIKILNGQICNPEIHQQRMDRTREEVLGLPPDLILREDIRLLSEHSKGLWKCRIVYSEKILSVVFNAYIPRKISTIQLVEAGNLNYKYKYEDRGELDRLFSLRGIADDILLIKNCQITDTSYSNIAFRSGKKWFTPSMPLLNGTKRQSLLKSGFLTEEE